MKHFGHQNQQNPAIIIRTTAVTIIIIPLPDGSSNSRPNGSKCTEGTGPRWYQMRNNKDNYLWIIIDEFPPPQYYRVTVVMHVYRG